MKRGKSIVRVFSGAPEERIFVPGYHKSYSADRNFIQRGEGIIDKCKQIFLEPAGHLATPV